LGGCSVRFPHAEPRNELTSPATFQKKKFREKPWAK
jgi:hypothetical protein